MKPLTPEERRAAKLARKTAFHSKRIVFQGKKIEQQQRREASRDRRIEAAQLAYDRGIVDHLDNGDEQLPRKLMSFTKGLPHDATTGLIVDENHFDTFVTGICSGDPAAIDDTPLGPTEDFADLGLNDRLSYWLSNKGQTANKLRGWESASAGLTFDLQGPDAQAVTMPPAPKLGSDELTAEMAEVYCQAILRDIPFTRFASDSLVRDCVNSLNQLPYFQEAQRNNQFLTLQNAFRGFTAGDLVGPYISQFLLAGSRGLGRKSNGTVREFDAKDGYINYGAITIDQRVRNAVSGVDYLTDWDEFLDVQNGADFRGLEQYIGDNSTTTGPLRKFITTGRDLATYVHYDALYQAYLNAALLLLSYDAPFDEGVPFIYPDEVDKQQGFAHYGGPHILTLVTEVATRALKAVRYQKFNVHRRLRPEAFAARLERRAAIAASIGLNDSTSTHLARTYDDIDQTGIFGRLGTGNILLPMAFCEGSPMHPTYGAGHATVAGACVTVLKAFFNHRLYMNVANNGATINFTANRPAATEAFVPTTDGRRLRSVPSTPLTVAGELNKLAANISIGRDWAGVHYYSDYKESLLLGEEIAIGLLEEQALMYNPVEEFTMTIPKFDGTEITIGAHAILSNSVQQSA
ncbi:MAG: vanadium-dependent haloperoxidase [Bacteroidota bacterium]